jgi:hypothetical protein
MAPLYGKTQVSNKSLGRTIRECLGDICDCLAKKIDDIVNSTKAPGSQKGLAQRFAEQIAGGASGPGTSGWDLHQNIIKNDQQNLKQHVDEFDAQGCGGGLPANARQYANRPLPSPAEWEVNNPGIDPLTGAKIAVGVGTGALLLYGGYKLLRAIGVSFIGTPAAGLGSLVLP